MKRRGFLATMFGAICAPFVPTPKVPRPQLTINRLGLVFHKDAFAIAMEPLVSVESTSRGSELFVTSGEQGYVWSADDLAERGRSGRPVLDTASIRARALVEGIVEDAKHG